MEYKQYLKSNDWKQKRSKKLVRKRRCGICGSTDNVDIHHLNYKKLYNVDSTDLRKLCRRCHYLAHRLHKEGKIIFRNTNHHSRFAILKSAVKKELGMSTTNMF